MEQIIAAVRGFPGAFVLAPEPGGDFPELAWGDAFFYYAPDARPPRHTQPYATVVTKNLPGDTTSDLDPPDRWRVNIHAGRTTTGELTGTEPHDHSATDTLLPHPVYGAHGWICVINPGPRTTDTVLRLLRRAHDDARARFGRRHGGGEGDGMGGS
ncbi:DUF6194 family protein [Streptomyces sp. NPDC101175]|uniref:DUF6194 family protein n=1 Tax=Streptomyces sp. NPDC101175 TaxID=3366123 RepID=UPI0038371DB8